MTWLLIAIVLLVIFGLGLQRQLVETETDRLNWFEVVPERFIAFQNSTCSRNHIFELLRFLREHFAGEPIRLIEEYHDCEISLHDRGRLDWDRFEQGLTKWEFSRWQRFPPDSSMTLAGPAFYLVIDVEIPGFSIGMAEEEPGREEFADVLKGTFGATLLEPAAFEWRFLSHAEQEVAYSGDRHSYTSRSETKLYQKMDRPRWLEVLIAVAIGLLAVWLFSRWL